MGWKKVESRMERSALALFVPGIFANHADDIVPPHDFAAFTKTFDGSSDFHDLGFLWLGLENGWRGGAEDCSCGGARETSKRRGGAVKD
jgi:hypothetical protein